MTTVFVRRHGPYIAGLTVSGHAGFAMEGGDIVCAAISTLTATCANALETVAGVVPTVIREAKTATISIDLPRNMHGQSGHDAQIVMQTILQGFSDIALQYPKNLEINDGRTSSC